MYNMQTSMRLGGGRVDERKDYFRSSTKLWKYFANLYRVNRKFWLHGNTHLSIPHQNADISNKQSRVLHLHGVTRFSTKRDILKWGYYSISSSRFGGVKRIPILRGGVWLTRNEVVA